MDRRGREFKIERGVRQEDPLSPNLFNCLLEQIFRKLDWAKKGIKIDGEYFNNLRFAVDVVLIATSGKKMVQLAQELTEKIKKFVLKINIKKTKILARGKNNGLKKWFTYAKYDYSKIEEGRRKIKDCSKLGFESNIQK